MPRIDNDTFYKNALKKYGRSAKGLNWHDDYSQIKRFEVLHEMIKEDLKEGDSLIDAGCGFGDFYHFINPLCKIRYRGYEIVEENIAIAKEHTKQKIEHKDILKDPLEKADFYIASGSMNILSRFETYLFIERCFEQSQKGFAFNLLYGKDRSKSFNYFLPQEIKHFCKKFDCEIKTRTGYLPHDFTVYLKKI
jgi:SAM-dependent methyltransferase